MDFSYKKEEEMLRKTVSEFAQNEVAPRAIEMDEKGEFPRDLVKKMGEMGFIGTILPEEYGGSGMGHVARMICIEEISKVSPSLGFFFETGQIGIPLLYNFGSEEQKKKYLPEVVSGEKIFCCALTEPSGGSDPSGTMTEAKREGDEYVVNGRKVFITLGEVADVCAFLAKTENGFSAFIVEKGTPGFEIGRREKIAGLGAIPVNELIFSDCRIPKENMIGKEGKGLGAILTAIQIIGRTGGAGVALGIAGGAYEAALKFSKERVLYGKPISKLQSIQFKLADMYIRLQACRWLVYNVAWLLDSGKNPREIGKEIAAAKVFATETARDIALAAVHLHGGYGTIPEYNVIRYLRDSIELITATGTNDIMRVIIAGEITR
ncbi:MAG: acyl-CoA dehydrogenase family protein [Candidatus Syntropharchaeia archaeon]